jgi:hypothetical protein
MAFFDSQESVFFIDDTGSDSRDLSDYIVAINGLPGPRELSEATSLADAGRKWHPSLENSIINLELMWSDDTLVGPDTVLGPLRTHTAAVDFNYGPEGGTSGDVKYYGTCWVRNYNITSRVGNLVMATAELQVNGQVSRGTFPVV